MDQEEVYEKTQGSSYFVYLKRRVETSVRDEINQFLEADGISSGVRLIEDYKRYYPYGTVASTVLGFTGTDGQGLEGLELQYDTQLRGTAGPAHLRPERPGHRYALSSTSSMWRPRTATTWCSPSMRPCRAFWRNTWRRAWTSST